MGELMTPAEVAEKTRGILDEAGGHLTAENFERVLSAIRESGIPVAYRPVVYYAVGQTIEHSVEDPCDFSPREGWND